VDGSSKKKINKNDDSYSVKEEIKQEIKKEIKKEEKKEEKKAKADAKKDSKNYVKLSSALENSYIDLDKPLEKKEDIKKDDEGFTMADLDFTSTK
ncbi:MAG: hypothetical protein MJ151_04835, partial [Lachnospiraceae bacterium]|nr:hypothetical protein [Lachnospiraceae bacterium]